MSASPLRTISQIGECYRLAKANPEVVANWGKRTIRFYGKPLLTAAVGAAGTLVAKVYLGTYSSIAVLLVSLAFWVKVNRNYLLQKFLGRQLSLQNPNGVFGQLNGMAILALMLLGKKTTYSYQTALPELPIPSLKETMAKLRASSKPLLSQEEGEEFDKLVDKFLSDPKQGAQLQRMMKLYCAGKGYGQTLNELWEEWAYRRDRTPLVGAVGSPSYFGSRGRQRLKTTFHSQPLIGYGAHAIYHARRFWDMVKSEKVPPRCIRPTVPICMDQYRFLCGTTQLPVKESSDPSYQGDIVKEHPDSKHVIVYCKGRYYKVETHHPKAGRPLRLEEIEFQLQNVWSHAEKHADEQEPSVGMLTAQDRNTWADDYQLLYDEHVNNAASLGQINSAMMLLILDESEPEDLTEHANACYMPKGGWYDKGLQPVFFANGYTGACIGHTKADALPPARMLSWGLAQDSLSVERQAISDHDKAVLSEVQPLHWKLPDALKEKLPKLEEELDKRRTNMEFQAMHVKHIDKDLLRKKKVPSDAFVQMALQLAYYRIHKRFRFTYETAGTRFFRMGRTDTGRSVSQASVDWVKAMEDKDASNKERTALLEKAMMGHTQYMIDASVGKGVDRHLLFLKGMAAKAGLDIPLFKHKGCNFPIDIATSQVPCNFMGGGFAPLTQDGYGVCYSYLKPEGKERPGSLVLHISSMKDCEETSSEQFKTVLGEVFEEMLALV